MAIRLEVLTGKTCSKIQSCDRVCDEEYQRHCSNYKPFSVTQQSIRRGELACLVPYVFLRDQQRKRQTQDLNSLYH